MAVYYFTREDLEDALGVQTVKSIFDENNSGQPTTRPLNACRLSGTTDCISFMRATYAEAALPTAEGDTIPDELKFAALDFGIAYALRRRPDLVRAMGEESWTTFQTSAIDKMKRYASTQQRLARATATPDNVGSTVGVPSVEDPNSGVVTTRSTTFSDMGDY